MHNQSVQPRKDLDKASSLVKNTVFANHKNIQSKTHHPTKRAQEEDLASDHPIGEVRNSHKSKVCHSFSMGEQKQDDSTRRAKKNACVWLIISLHQPICEGLIHDPVSRKMVRLVREHPICNWCSRSCCWECEFSRDASDDRPSE